eukprot:CAMPEP_0196666272 /NCGR_PEP_ID=MMETSP1086-20130531/64417_1 /TAXON_ID=77921 /ORGANISM="Cyanoptyche  gloeocystis , Strain SAG4.97" /LENGTH=57 /DNA_ID=CAMNT_0042003441 /DNA_START=63 /DNA_END=236 /DNA_ORIENTATION=+
MGAVGEARRTVRKTVDFVAKKAKVIVHWGYIPLILYLGVTSSDPPVSWEDLLWKTGP